MSSIFRVQTHLHANNWTILALFIPKASLFSWLATCLDCKWSNLILYWAGKLLLHPIPQKSCNAPNFRWKSHSNPIFRSKKVTSTTKFESSPAKSSKQAEAFGENDHHWPAVQNYRHRDVARPVPQKALKSSGRKRGGIIRTPMKRSKSQNPSSPTFFPLDRSPLNMSAMSSGLAERGRVSGNRQRQKSRPNSTTNSTIHTVQRPSNLSILCTSPFPVKTCRRTEPELPNYGLLIGFCGPGWECVEGVLPVLLCSLYNYSCSTRHCSSAGNISETWAGPAHVPECPRRQNCIWNHSPKDSFCRYRCRRTGMELLMYESTWWVPPDWRTDVGKPMVRGVLT